MVFHGWSPLYPTLRDPLPLYSLLLQRLQQTPGALCILIGKLCNLLCVPLSHSLLWVSVFSLMLLLSSQTKTTYNHPYHCNIVLHREMSNERKLQYSQPWIAEELLQNLIVTASCKNKRKMKTPGLSPLPPQVCSCNDSSLSLHLQAVWLCMLPVPGANISLSSSSSQQQQFFRGWGSSEIISVFPTVINTSGVMTDLALAAGFVINTGVVSPPLTCFGQERQARECPSFGLSHKWQLGFQRAGSAFHGTLGFESLPPITNILGFCFLSIRVLFHCQSAWDI